MVDDRESQVVRRVLFQPLRGLTLVALAAISFAQVDRAVATPFHVSEPVVLDAGNRYHDWLRGGWSRIQQRGDTLGFFVGDRHGGVRAYFRTTTGADFFPDRSRHIADDYGRDVLWEGNDLLSVEIGWNPPRATLARRDLRTGSFQVSASLGDDFDPVETQLRLMRLGEIYLVAGIGEELQLARVADDLSLIDRPSWFHAPAMGRAIAMEAHPDSGALLAWFADSSLVVLPLDDDGTSDGSEPIRIAPADHVTRVDVEPWQSDWLVVWQEQWDAVHWVRVDRAGRPGQVNTLSRESGAGSSIGGMAAATHDDVAIISWRSDLTTECCLISGFGRTYQTLGPSVVGYPESVTEQHLDARWDGDAFVVAWDDWKEPPTVRDGCDYSELFAHLAARAAWIDDRGQVRGEPLVLNRVHRTTEAWPHYVDGDIRVVMRNEHSASYQQVTVDRETRTVSPLSEYIVIRDEDWCEYRMRGTIARESTNGDLVVAHLVENDAGNYDHLEVLGVSERGTWWQGSISNTSPPLDLAAVGRDVWVAQTAQRGHEGIEISRPGIQGPGTIWYVGSSRAGQSSLAIVDDERALVLWIDQVDQGPRQPWFAIVDRRTTPGTVVGAPLFPDPSVNVVDTELVRSPSGFLAVLRVPTTGGTSSSQLQVARFSNQGVPIDSIPMPLSHEARIEDFEGVWDGTNYFVAWSESEPQRRLVARRVHPRRGVADAAPGLLVAGTSARPHLAADPASGLVAMTYGRDRLVTITADPVPVVLTDLKAERASTGVEISWTLHLADGFAWFDVDRVRDGSPADRVNDEPVVPRDGVMSVIDPDPAPAGTEYWVRGVSQSGDVYSYGPVFVGPDSPGPLALIVHPNPAPGPIMVEFMLPGRSVVEIELFDAAGRRVALERLGSLGARRHVVSWSENVVLGAGAYWVRLSAGRESRVASLRVVR